MNVFRQETEHNPTVPALDVRAALAEFLGYDPDAQASGASGG
jgi:hypothetical protein